MLIEFAAVLKEEMEDLADWVEYLSDVGVAFRYMLVLESFSPHKHTLQDIDHLYLQLRVRYLLVDREEDVQDVGFLLLVSEVVELGG